MTTPISAGRYDTIVLGAGHNGLVLATLLAKRGQKVLVVEKTATFGGLAAGTEFHPGFWSPGIFHDTSALRSDVVERLKLRAFGLRIRPEAAPVFAASASGPGLILRRDPRAAAAEIGAHSTKDAGRYADYHAFIARIAPILRNVFDAVPPDVQAMSFPGLWELLKSATELRRLGKRDMMEFLRIGPMCVADWLNEWFESDILKSALAAPAIHHTFTGPWSPGSNANLLLAEAFANPEVIGGPQAFAKALVAAAEKEGVLLRASAEVKEVVVAQGAVTGVVLTSGEILPTRRVAAACDPKQLFLKLLSPAGVSSRLAAGAAAIRARGTTAKLHLALSRRPELGSRPDLKADYVRTTGTFDEMERAFDAVKYREVSSEPTFDIYFPTDEAPELAPKDRHVMSVLIHFVPHHPDGGWTPAKKEALYTRALAGLERHYPGLSKAVLAHELLTPADLEARFNLSGGHLHHGEHAADQLLVRPTLDCARYATPIAGLFLCGSGSHPGGGITGAPGALAARVMGG